MATEAIKKTYLDLVIDSDEELGILDSSYIEDYYGIDGQLTLHHQDTAQEFDIVMAPVDGGGPYPNDHFEGTRDATVMPLGIYEVRGRVRDTVGNYTILTAFQNPNGNERVLELLFSLVESLGVVYAKISGLKSYVDVLIKAKQYLRNPEVSMSSYFDITAISRGL
ncbi:MAG: hypothetical protein GXP46_01945 [Deferribacteres bacterium]|nr:hypothetical protein [Deferribacteres bacterium]